MLTLPKIVAAIREQKPGVVPDAFGCWRIGLGGTVPDDVACDWCDDDGQVFLPQPVAIAVLEAALHKHRIFNDETGTVFIGEDGVTLEAEYHGRYRDDFGSDHLALIRALCHAIGVRLEDGNG